MRKPDTIELEWALAGRGFVKLHKVIGDPCEQPAGSDVAPVQPRPGDIAPVVDRDGEVTPGPHVFTQAQIPVDAEILEHSVADECDPMRGYLTDPYGLQLFFGDRDRSTARQQEAEKVESKPRVHGACPLSGRE